MVGCHGWWFVVTGGDGVVIVVVVLFLFLFFFFLCCVVIAKVEWWLWPVVVMAVADGRGGCGWCCGFFSFLVVGYIILL